MKFVIFNTLMFVFSIFCVRYQVDHEVYADAAFHALMAVFWIMMVYLGLSKERYD